MRLFHPKAVAQSSFLLSPFFPLSVSPVDQFWFCDFSFGTYLLFSVISVQTSDSSAVN